MSDVLRVAGPITTHSDGTFEDAESGPLAWQYPVFDGDDHADTIAWFPNLPGRWWLRCNVVDILGEADIARAGLLREPVILHETPQDWLRSELGYSACIVNWRADPRTLFGYATEILCSSGALEERLRRRILECCQPPFNIKTVRDGRHAAA